jgi:hypothetical protein
MFVKDPPEGRKAHRPGELPVELAGEVELEAAADLAGKTVRHRLNRGGDRALNRAIHAIALTLCRSNTRLGGGPALLPA